MRSLIIAHRGASYHAPENTLAAFRAAAELGADGIETDVQLTGDGNLVIHHNYTIDACSNGRGAIAQMNLRELKAYDFGSHKGEEWAGESILTLDECLDAAEGFRLVDIELKAPLTRAVPFVKAVTDAIRTHGMTERVVVSAFDHNLLREVKRFCPDLRVGVLTMPTGFSGNRLFALMQAYLPRNTNLSEITRGDLPDMPRSVFDPAAIGIPGTDAPEAMVELAHQMGAVYPLFTLREAAQAMAAQDDLVAYVSSLDFKPNYLHCHYSSVLQDPSLVSRLAQIGIGVSSWTPDDPEELQKLSDLGCTAIITNRPDILLEIQRRAFLKTI